MPIPSVPCDGTVAWMLDVTAAGTSPYHRHRAISYITITSPAQRAAKPNIITTPSTVKPRYQREQTITSQTDIDLKYKAMYGRYTTLYSGREAFV